MSDALGATPPDPDSDGCLCVVASFFSAARTINEVTAEAAKRAMMSPVLSDFIEFRFADLGPQPEQGDDRSPAIRRITDALLNPQGIAGRNYFALVVVDRSAAVIDQMLSDCAASPFLDKLPMRSLGIANSDDRPNRGQAREPHSSPEIVTSPRGVWSRKDDLVRCPAPVRRRTAARFFSPASTRAVRRRARRSQGEIPRAQDATGRPCGRVADCRRCTRSHPDTGRAGRRSPDSAGP